MNTKLKIAIIGAGIWGENHAKIYQAHPFVDVTAICDLNKEKAAAVAARTGIPAVYDNVETMLAEADCDAVSIVTPDFAHGAIAVAAANHGKHMLIEKPLATSREDVFRIIDAAEKNKVRVMVDLHNRWSPPFNGAHQALENGEIGKPLTGYMRLNDTKWVATDMLPWAASSSILWFLGSHSLDTLSWFFDSRVKRVYSVSRSGLLKELGVDTVDAYLTTLEFENGGIAQMENGWITPNANPCVNDIKFNILGEKGMLSIDASHHNLVQKYTDTAVTVPDVIVQNSIFGMPKGFAFESIRSFADCLLSGEDFHVSMYQAADVSLALLAIMDSAEKRMPVEVKY